MKHAYDYGDDLIDKLTIQALMEELTEEDRAILRWIYWNQESYANIGIVIGEEFRDKILSGSGIRFLRDEIYAALKEKLVKDGIQGPKG